MTAPVYEVVLYSIKDAVKADHARTEARKQVRTFPGFRSFLPLTDMSDPMRRADIVEWASIETARAAAETVQRHPDFAPFMASVAKLDRMGHYAPQPSAADNGSGRGVELGFFRLKAGVSEAQARAAHAKAVDGFLSAQPGWIAEYFVRFDDGLYLDLLLAESRERAEAICALWSDHSDCSAFVALVENVEMTFGRAL